MTAITTNSIKLPTAGLIVLKEGKLLLAFSNNKKAWYLPGGKIDANETAIEALQREIQEELNIVLNPALLQFYCHITAPAYGELECTIMEQDCFLYKLVEAVQADNEIGALQYFDLLTYQKEPVQVPGVLQVFDHLTKDGLV